MPASKIPPQVAEFLAGTRFAVAGVSRQSHQPANAIFRKLRDAGYDVVPLNPNAARVEGTQCFPNLASVPAHVDRVVVATHPRVTVELVRQCAEHGVGYVWFHRSFGDGSVSREAVAECEARGIKYIEGGCPLMFCEPVDIGHRCIKWWLQRRRRIPA
jgi:predicted CoA-binding protein